MTKTETLAQHVEKHRATERAELYARYRSLLDRLDEPAEAREAPELKYVMDDLSIDDALFATHCDVRREAKALADEVALERRNLYDAQQQIAAGGVPVDTAAIAKEAKAEAAADPARFPEPELHILDAQAEAVERAQGSIRELVWARGMAGTAMTSATIKLRRLKTDFRELLVDVVPEKRS